MTDEQIMQRLEYKRGEIGVQVCIDHDLLDETINLVNRRNNLIEQLGNDVNRKYDLICKLEEEVETAKSEAIKEFVEKLTDKIFVYIKYVDVDGVVILNRILRMMEDIEKEMTEVQK